MNSSHLKFRQDISILLSSRTPRNLRLESSGRAAVLMPIFPKGGEYFFLLTLRTQNVETHKGQISFPGGIMEPGDESLIDTALRETREEIGLATDKVEVLGRFDEYLSITGLIVTPFVGWIEPPFELDPNPNEVEEILYVPFELFRDRALLRVEMSKRFDQDYPIYYYNFQGRDVWGLTARIIRDFLILIDCKSEMKS